MERHYCNSCSAERAWYQTALGCRVCTHCGHRNVAKRALTEERVREIVRSEIAHARRGAWRELMDDEINPRTCQQKPPTGPLSPDEDRVLKSLRDSTLLNELRNRLRRM